MTPEALEKALREKDTATLMAALGHGLDSQSLDPHWRDAQGRMLTHHAAVFGDEAFADAVLAAGVPALCFDENSDTPQDIAAVFGHKTLAEKFSAAAKGEEKSLQPLPYVSMQEIRDQNENHVFYHLVRQGRLREIVDLAVKTEEGFCLDDLMRAGPDGNSSLLRICQRGELELLVQTSLWWKNPKDFQAVMGFVPQEIRKTLNVLPVLADLRISPAAERRRGFLKPPEKTP